MGDHPITPSQVCLKDITGNRPDQRHRLLRTDETPNTKGARSLATMLSLPGCVPFREATSCVTLYDAADKACTANAADTLGNPKLVKEDGTYEVNGRVLNLYYEVDEEKLKAAEQHARAEALAAVAAAPAVADAGGAAAAFDSSCGTTPAPAPPSRTPSAAAATTLADAGGAAGGSSSQTGRQRGPAGSAHVYPCCSDGRGALLGWQVRLQGRQHHGYSQACCQVSDHVWRQLQAAAVG